MSKLINISELTKKLNIVNTSNKKILSHTLRYWEKEFKIIRQKKLIIEILFIKTGRNYKDNKFL